MRRSRLFLTRVSASALFLTTAGVSAAVINTCDEPSLRAALAGGGTITFACDGTIALQSSIAISTNTILDATGRQVVLNGNFYDRIFTISSNTTCVLRGLHFVNGRHAVEGGAVRSSGTLDISRCIFSNNAATPFSSGGRGGALFSEGALTVSESMFITNLVGGDAANPGLGGAIRNGGATMKVTGCTFVGNRSFGNGGAVSTTGFLFSGPSSSAWMTNCTFFGNKAISGIGTAVYNESGPSPHPGQFVHLVNCTLAQNTAQAIAGLNIRLGNSILIDGSSSAVDGGNNVFSSAFLGPLADNGGPTLTMALLPGSQAIDTGNNAICPPVDQRGVARPIRATCDCGALETSVEPVPAVIQFAAATFSTNESSTNAIISVTRSGNTAVSISVNYEVMPGTALPRHDYRATNGTLSFGPGQTNRTIAIGLVNDQTPEGTETVLLTLSQPSGTATLGNPASATLAIQDNDPVQAGALRFQHSVYKVAEGVPQAAVEVIRVGGTNGVVTADYATVPGTAFAGIDYQSTQGTVVFGDAETRKTITVGIAGDQVAEGLETFGVNLSNPGGGATLASPFEATVEINDQQHFLSSCGEGALRAAVAAGGTIRLACDGTVHLASTLIITNAVHLDATGHQVTLSGSQAVRLFKLAGGVQFLATHLIFADGLARGTNGNAGESGGRPGGEGVGGALWNDGGRFIASHCTFSRNRAQGGDGGDPLGLTQPGGAGGAARGGAIFNGAEGQLVISNSIFASNEALGGTAGNNRSGISAGGEAMGGAVYNEKGSVEFISCALSTNLAIGGSGKRFNVVVSSAPARGGALFNQAGTVFLARSVLSENSARVQYLNNAFGGAVYADGGSVRMEETRVTRNSATAGNGLGISSPAGLPGGNALGGAVYLGKGELSVERSTVDANFCRGGTEPGGGSRAGSGLGGAIYSDGQMFLRNSTLMGNRAVSGVNYNDSLFLKGQALGGSVHNNGGDVWIVHCTFSSNLVAHASGGTSTNLQGGTLFTVDGQIALEASIIAHSRYGSNAVGVLVDLGRNLSSDSSCNFTASGSLNNTNPLLSPLADFGGPTPTVALLAGSPAINGAAATGPPTDQRGISRPFGVACDIGAFESAPPYTVLGRVAGYYPASAGILVNASPASAAPDALGRYALQGLAAGNHLVMPTSPEAVFVMSNRLLNVTTDVIDVNFHSYRSNALTVERLGVGEVRTVFAGEVGQTQRVLLSTNLLNWEPHSTNTVESSGLFYFYDTNSASGRLRSFRAVPP